MANAHGLGAQTCGTAAKLAALGYVAIATDLYGAGARADDQAGAGELIRELWGNVSLVRARTGAWLERLRDLEQVDGARLAAIGYCFGGQNVLELARSGADVKLVVSYHGILKTGEPAAPGTVIPRVAVYTGTLDPYVPAEDVTAFRAEMEAAGALWQITEFSGVYHSFTDETAAQPDKGLQYDAAADAQSWAGTVTLLATI